MKALTTMTGLALDVAIGKMKEILEPEAYSAVKGTGADLTDVNPAYLREVATDVFGMCGIGWIFHWDPEHFETIEERRESNAGKVYTTFVSTITRLELTIFLRSTEKGDVVESAPILSTGSSDNSNKAWAMRGALTSAIVGAFNQLCWQLPVHQGKVSHRNVAQIQKDNGGSASTPEPKPVTQPAVRPLSPEALCKALLKKAEQRETSEDDKLKSNSRGLVVGVLEQIFAGPNATQDRYAFTFAVFGAESSGDLSGAQVLALDDWLKPTKDEGGAWGADPMASTEAVALLDGLIANGSMENGTD